MADTPADRGDVVQSVPGEPFEDPFGPFASELDSLRVALELAFDDHGAFVQSVVDDVLASAPEERFEGATALLLDHLREEVGSVDAFESRLPDGDGASLVRDVQQVVRNVRADTLQGVFFVRTPEGHLVMAAALDAIDAAIEAAMASDAPTDGGAAADVAVALLCRLYALADDDEPEVSESLVRDVAGAVETLAAAEGGSAPADDPDSMAFEAVRQRVTEYGAVVAYRDLDVSLNRGAELAGLPQGAFVDLLSTFGVQPRYGPRSTEELRDDELVDE